MASTTKGVSVDSLTVKNDFSTRLLSWFDQHGRKDLPWQQDINAYRVWVSEIMLQQTQVSTVIPYYQRFMQRFPSVAQLANADEDEVLHHWSGLGYYSRARNLHKTAKIIVENHNCEFPQCLDTLISLPGIGRSTAGSICAIAFKQNTSILDGNVKRVLARHFAIEGWPGHSKTSQVLWQIATAHTPTQRTDAYTQAIMDLGAMICRRSSPDCNNCPLHSDCQARINDSIALYPGRKPKKTLPVKTTNMYLLLNTNNEILLEKRPPAGIWASLWSLPETASVLNGMQSEKPIDWPIMRHTFSHFHLDISPILYRLSENPRHIAEPSQLWYNIKQPQALGIAAPIQKLLSRLASEIESTAIV